MEDVGVPLGLAQEEPHQLENGLEDRLKLSTGAAEAADLYINDLLEAETKLLGLHGGFDAALLAYERL